MGIFKYFLLYGGWVMFTFILQLIILCKTDIEPLWIIHPDTQQKFIEDVRSVFGEKKNIWTLLLALFTIIATIVYLIVNIGLMIGGVVYIALNDKNR